MLYYQPHDSVLQRLRIEPLLAPGNGEKLPDLAPRDDSLDRKDTWCHFEVLVDACINIHSEYPQHDGDKTAYASVAKFVKVIGQDFTHPPVEVPAMRSKYSHGSTRRVGCFAAPSDSSNSLSRVRIIALRMYKEDKPRIPPPSERLKINCPILLGLGGSCAYQERAVEVVVRLPFSAEHWFIRTTIVGTLPRFC